MTQRQGDRSGGQHAEEARCNDRGGASAGIVQALAKSQSPEVGQALAEKLPTLTPATRPAAVRSTLISQARASPRRASLRLQLIEVTIFGIAYSRH